MTYLDAAYATLRTASQPLHFGGVAANLAEF